METDKLIADTLENAGYFWTSLGVLVALIFGIPGGVFGILNFLQARAERIPTIRIKTAQQFNYTTVQVNGRQTDGYIITIYISVYNRSLFPLVIDKIIFTESASKKVYDIHGGSETDNHQMFIGSKNFIKKTLNTKFVIEKKPISGSLEIRTACGFAFTTKISGESTDLIKPKRSSF